MGLSTSILIAGGMISVAILATRFDLVAVARRATAPARRFVLGGRHYWGQATVGAALVVLAGGVVWLSGVGL